ncbi:hypothetical protein F5Y07DRAFT_140399 [Xylaria sp. FL0933]|nr:hypothetical protein F5Y07DRAFT_140399 [Xylaria sp. FL0933]
MGDPLSTAASIIAVLQLAGTATAYLKDLKNGATDRMRLRDELRSTVCILEMLKDRVEDADDTETVGMLKPTSIQALEAQDGPLALFKRILEDIIHKISPHGTLRRLGQPLMWPFDKKEISDYLVSLERLKTHFSLLMQNDILELAKITNIKLDGIYKKLDDSEDKSRDVETQTIIQWISPLSFRATHTSVLESAQPGTGRWLLDHEVFRRWVTGEISILWCWGIPGAGKTTLASLVVNSLEQDANALENTICTYIYCNFNLVKEQTTAALLGAVLQQTLHKSNDDAVPPEVSLLYKLHHKYNTRPTPAQLQEILVKVISKYSIFHVVVDALDECAESDEDAVQFISMMRSLGPNVKVLCTSRHSAVFENYFSGEERLQIEAQGEDILMFLDSEIQRQQRLSRHIKADPSLKEDIMNTVTEESQGMFLLAKLHIDSLSQRITRKQVRSSLRTLPTTLDSTYANALQRVYDQAPEIVELAELVLFWVICARRQLTILELQHMYATHNVEGETVLEEDDLPDEEALTSACRGLVIVDGISPVVRVVHYTAQEYFERTHAAKLFTAKSSLTIISLSYLALPNFSDGACATDSAMSERLEKYPFLVYAANHWGSEAAQLDDDFWSHFKAFASCPAAIEVACQVSSIHGIRYTNWSQAYPRSVPLLVLAAVFDIPIVLRHLVSNGYSVESKGTDSETALIRAAARGHTINVEVLLQLGADVNARDYMDETALQRAAKIGNEDIIRTLLKSGADANITASGNWTALMSAVSSGNIDAVRLLMQAGADLAVETEWGDSALSIATRTGQVAIATFLADSGAILPRGPAGRRASLVASRRGHAQLVKRLTADYKAVAGRTLERQRPIPVRGLAKIAEGLEPPVAPAADAPTAQTSTSLDDDGFLELMESFGNRTGFSKRYSLLEPLGRGHYAEVYTASHKATGAVYAVKILPYCRKNGKFYKAEFESMQELQEEHHPNILRLIDAFTDYAEKKILFVQELGVHGELFNFIVKKVKLTEDETRTIFSQMFSALAYCHGLGWVHRDIKPENILLTDTANLTVKIADFGLATKLVNAEGGRVLAKTLCGTPSYVAPEVLAGDPLRPYGTGVDVWSCGVVLYICLCGFPPFSDELYSREFPYTLSQQIKHGKFDYPSPYWDSVGDPALDLIDRMLVVDVDKRYCIEQCIRDPWLSGSTVSIPDHVPRVSSPEPIDIG